MRSSMLTHLAAIGTVFALGSPALASEPSVRLILQITVDQLRTDLIDRFATGYGDGGFRRLLDQGAFYVDAHHRHANTETVVGHATLATGTDPAIHGMVANVWLDRATGELTYNVEDADFPLVGEGGGIDAATEIDPTQKIASTQGRSRRSDLSITGMCGSMPSPKSQPSISPEP